MRLQIPGMHNGLEKAFFQQKLRAPKALRQFLADGLFNHAADRRSRSAGRADSCGLQHPPLIKCHRAEKENQNPRSRRCGSLPAHILANDPFGEDLIQ